MNTTLTLGKVFFLVALILFILTALGVASLVALGLAFTVGGFLVQ